MPYPDHEHEIRNIVEAHRQQENEPLLLALYFPDPNYADYDNLLEVYRGYDQDRVSSDQTLLTTAFGPAASGFAVMGNILLRIIITNPNELNAALTGNWPGIQQIRTQIRAGAYQIIHQAGNYFEDVRQVIGEENIAA